MLDDAEAAVEADVILRRQLAANGANVHPFVG